MYEALKRQIGKLLGIDLDQYKSHQMRRRVETFVARQGGNDPRAFIQTIQRDRELLNELRDMLTINVSEFFRDAAQYDRLRNQVLPEILETRGALRFWSAGCSGGQEPYSFSILMEELAPKRQVQILATDLDRAILQRAQARGPYMKADLKNVSADQRETHFEETPEGHFVDPRLARRVRFSELNLLSDRYESGFDLISCRNVLIYFETAVKTRIILGFQNSLKPGGVLFIGATEALLGAEREGFQALGGNFYRKPADAVAKAA